MSVTAGPPNRARRRSGWLDSTRVWLGLGILAPIVMVAVCTLMLLELRQDAWDKAEQILKNLVQVIERDIDRNVEIIDLALRSAVQNLTLPNLGQISPEYRQRILFDRAVHARDLGVMLVLDEHGNTLYDALGWPPRRLNNARRDYFQAHKADPGLGLHISRPLISSLMGEPIIVLSRRIDKADGTFGGLVLGSPSLSSFDRLFERIKLGRKGTIALFLGDGTRLVRHPEPNAELAPNFAHSPNVQRFLHETRGSFVGITPGDGIEQLYVFAKVGDLPLYLTVALSTREIEAEWQAQSLVFGLLVLAPCGLTVGLSVLIGREFRRRPAREAELVHLLHTDALTGLANLRACETTVGRAWAEARRRRGRVALLVVDADHFKRYNDRYGHAFGDRVLQALASGTRRPGDLVARVGREEFAVLLPDTDADSAARVAGAMHEAVAGLIVEADNVGVGPITVSIGFAFGVPGRDDVPADLLSLADAALYEAKASGRNRTCYAVMSVSGTRVARPDLPLADDRCANPSRPADLFLDA